MNSEAQIRQLLESGIQALEDGHKAKARALLAHVLRLDAQNEWAWYYLSRTMTTTTGAAWCLKKVLSINPRHIHARQLLRKIKGSADSLTPQQRAQEPDWGESTQPLGPQGTPGAVSRRRSGEVAARLIKIGRLLDAQELQLRALESRPDDRDARLKGIQPEDEATAAGLQSDTQAVLEAHEELACELDELLDDIFGAAQQLDTVQRRLSRAEVGIARTERATNALEARVDSLEYELAPLRPTLRGVRTELGNLDARSARTERSVASLERQVAALRRERARAPLARPRWAVLPTLAVVLGLILISIGALEAYPYVASRLAPVLVGRAQADAESASPETAPLSTSVALTAEPSPEIGSATALDSAATITPTQAPPTPVPPTPVPPTPVPTPIPAIPTRLVVPDIGIDAPVVPVSWQPTNETAQSEGAWDVPDGGLVGWHSDSAPLGVPGNTVLNGHNTTGGEVFRNLYTLGAGAEITVYSNDVAFSYVVSETLILPELGQPREVRERNASYLQPTADERLTLVTCHPYGSLRNRLIVIARPR